MSDIVSRNLFSRATSLCLIAAGTGLWGGCSTYVTPARGISMASLAKADAEIAERMKREPQAQFPAHIAVARVQEPGYRSYRCDSYGEGRYSVVTTRDVEKESDWNRLEKMPQVAGVAPLNRLVLPSHLESDKDLRLAAAGLKADLLLAYSFDTKFRIDEHDFGPLRAISLGMLPTKEAKVTVTASAGVFDVRTGYIYGLAEATAQEKQIASSWTTEDAVDQSRQRAERKAFELLMGEIEGTWGKIVREYGSPHASNGPVTDATKKPN